MSIFNISNYNISNIIYNNNKDCLIALIQNNNIDIAKCIEIKKININEITYYNINENNKYYFELKISRTYDIISYLNVSDNNIQIEVNIDDILLPYKHDTCILLNYYVFHDIKIRFTFQENPCEFSFLYHGCNIKNNIRFDIQKEKLIDIFRINMADENLIYNESIIINDDYLSNILDIRYYIKSTKICKNKNEALNEILNGTYCAGYIIKEHIISNHNNIIEIPLYNNFIKNKFLSNFIIDNDNVKIEIVLFEKYKYNVTKDTIIYLSTILNFSGELNRYKLLITFLKEPYILKFSYVKSFIQDKLLQVLNIEQKYNHIKTHVIQYK